MDSAKAPASRWSCCTRILGSRTHRWQHGRYYLTTILPAAAPGVNIAFQGPQNCQITSPRSSPCCCSRATSVPPFVVQWRAISGDPFTGLHRLCVSARSRSELRLVAATSFRARRNPHSLCVIYKASTNTSGHALPLGSCARMRRPLGRAKASRNILLLSPGVTR
jgi:hypothetical protein